MARVVDAEQGGPHKGMRQRMMLRTSGARRKGAGGRRRWDRCGEAGKALAVRLRASGPQWDMRTVQFKQRAVQAAEQEEKMYVQRRLRCVVGGRSGVVGLREF